METHIEKTIASIDSRINNLQMLKISILHFLHTDDQPPNGSSLTMPLALKRPNSPRSFSALKEQHSPAQGNALGRAIKKANVALKGQNSRPRATSHNNIAIAAKLPQPFGPSDLAKALNLTKNGGTSQINRWLKRRWLRKVAPGQYERTAFFQQQLPSAPSIEPTKPTPAPAAKALKTHDELVTERNNALKHRDEARANGRDEIAAIFQKDIDNLDRLIDSL